jgi:hypothetical protein
MEATEMADDPRAEYDRIANDLAAEAGTVSSKMFGAPVLKTRGKAFAGMHGDYMIFKLRGAAHAEALALSGALLFDPSGMGRPMKEWVEVPFEHVERWPHLAREALVYVDELSSKDG